MVLVTLFAAVQDSDLEEAAVVTSRSHLCTSLDHLISREMDIYPASCTYLAVRIVNGPDLSNTRPQKPSLRTVEGVSTSWRSLCLE